MPIEKDNTAGPLVDQGAIDAAANQFERDQLQVQADADGTTETVAMDFVTVDITRDNTTTRVEVPAHEVPILELLHGEENVLEKGRKTLQVADIYPESEMDRLIRKYGKNGEEAVRRTYPNIQALADEAGLDMPNVKTKRNKSGEQASIIDHDNPDAEQSGAAKVMRIVKPAAKTSARPVAKPAPKPAAKPAAKSAKGKAKGK